MNKIKRPDMIPVFRPQPDTGSVIQPQPALLRLPRWHFQPLPPPQALDSLVVHLPTGIPQQSRNPAIAIAAILSGQLDHVGDQAIFFRSPLRQLALRGSMLAQHLAGSTLGNAQLTTDMVYAGPAASGAQKFSLEASVRISLSSVRSETARLSRSFSC